MGYEPEPWRPVDTILAAKLVGWSFAGRFRTLRKATLAAEMGTDVAETLYPHRLDHDATILNHNKKSSGAQSTGSADQPRIDPELTRWLSNFEAPLGVGSNSWVVSGEHTRSGAPILANDPHVPLMAPPVWYEMHLNGSKTHVRGVAFPGIPFPQVGENESGAWGVTIAYTDSIDFYDYEIRNGTYRYGDEFREFDKETKTIEVASGKNREVTVRKTVHGAVVEAESDGDELTNQIGVAWTGLTDTRTCSAYLAFGRSESLADFENALRRFDLPAQNFVYADRNGDTLYRAAGKVPIRQIDGKPVTGNRVFDGSAKEGEWPGFVPYGESTWKPGEGYIPFEEMPHVVNPEYIGTANQRIVDDSEYPHYLSEAYATPFRGIRLWERLDHQIASERPVTREFMRDLQRDTHDERAAMFVPTILDASGAVNGTAAELLADLEGWDYRMDRDSRAALVFARFLPHYRDIVFKSRLKKGLDGRRNPEEYYGNDWVLVTLSPDSAWFPNGRVAAIAEALSRTATELDGEDWETYGDYNTTAINHRFDQEWLNYPRYPTDGSEGSLNNFRKEAQMGSSWREVCPMDKSNGPSQATFPGGNDGSPFSDHYADQLRRWADVEYKSIPLVAPDSSSVQFTEDDR